MNRVWIPGWQAPLSCFNGVFNALGVAPEPVLTFADERASRMAWLESQVAELPEKCMLIGWSLGGMLAYELAQLSERVEQVLLINSNVRFAGGSGLNTAAAASFMQRYQRDPSAARQKFAALVDREQAGKIAPLLLEGDHSHSLLWLYDTVLMPPSRVPVSVLLAREDVLVPSEKASSAWSAFGASVDLVEGQHGLPVTDPARVAQWVAKHG